MRSCREVPADFHARYSVERKEYLYKIWDAPVRNPLLDGLVLPYKRRLDAGYLDCCAREFLGTHDFIGLDVYKRQAESFGTFRLRNHRGFHLEPGEKYLSRHPTCAIIT